MADVTPIFGAILLVDAVAAIILLWMENFTRYEGVVLWEEDSPVAPLFWGSVIVLLAGVVSLFDIPVWPEPSVAVNAGGVVAPLFVSALVVWRRRPSAGPLLAATALTALVSAAVASVVGIPYFLPFPASLLPSVTAAALAILFARGRLLPALDVSYIAASLGTLIGIDLVPLVGSGAAGGLVLGAAGILDLVFLSGVLAVAIVWSTLVASRVAHSATRRSIKRDLVEEAPEGRTFLWDRKG